MQVKIKYAYLNATADLFYQMPARGKRSRHLVRVIKVIDERLKLIDEQKMELIKEHSHLNEDGEPKVIKTEDGEHFDIKDLEAFKKDIDELMNESLVIDGGDYEETLLTVKDILLNTDREFQGKEAVLYNYLCEQFEQC
ncbi:DUF1617 family protein [Shouchella clausii]|uniref:DUF1617 family protein n=1 Tax=Shouchella clausii TaxID=79880 RepID=UPI001C738867|nr:DUF1617 family protein [Shouchella clausii]MBX0320211.1 DUF1617 family protein [Shouchella clausii]